MGLDMYLFCNSRTLTKEVNDKVYQGHDDNWAEWYTKRGIVIYWRKANAIHKWFVDNVQHGEDDCGNYDVDLDHLKELLDVCERVIADHGLADELLPTQPGFFFGSTDYDEYYFDDLQHTVDAINHIIASVKADDKYPWELVVPGEPDWYVTFTYHSSW